MWFNAPIADLFREVPPTGVSLPRPEYVLLGAWFSLRELVPEAALAATLGRVHEGALHVADTLVLDQPLTWVKGDLQVDGLIDSPDRNVLLVQGALRCRNAVFNRVFVTGPVTGQVLCAHELRASALTCATLFIGAGNQPDLEQRAKGPVMELGKKPKKGCPPEVLDGAGKVDRFKVSDWVRHQATSAKPPDGHGE